MADVLKHPGRKTYLSSLEDRHSLQQQFISPSPTNALLWNLKHTIPLAALSLPPPVQIPVYLSLMILHSEMRQGCQGCPWIQWWVMLDHMLFHHHLAHQLSQRPQLSINNCIFPHCSEKTCHLTIHSLPIRSTPTAIARAVTPQT